MSDEPIAVPPELLDELPDGWHVELSVPLDRLVQHPRNPRRGNLRKIRESIKAHGFVDAVIAQEGTNHVIIGNHRVQAAAAEGYTRAPVVIWAKCSDEQAERLMLAHNRASDEGDYDRTVLLSVLKDLDATSAGLEGTLYDLGEVDELRRITGALGADATSFLDDLRPPPDEHERPSGAGAEKAFHLTFPFTPEQRDVVLLAVNRYKSEHDVESSAVAVAAICEHWTGDHAEGD